MKVNRQNIRRYYESLIDDAGNPEELLDMFETIDDKILELEVAIEKRMNEAQHDDYTCAYDYDNEFMYAQRL
jgi:hypothetical protein